jgi:LacI family transcriptional regulator/LacI family repressor for deo operon, udp, cdd, tsx, nupC, and nupG
MAVTIDEIAKIAGVSRSTVARALKDHPKISHKTKLRVQQIADELGYVPNYVAQSLSISRTKTVGMVVTHASNPFAWKVIEGVEFAAHKHEYSVLFSTARNNRRRELEIIEAFRRRRVDGIIVSSSHMGHLYSADLQEIDIPVVLINEQQPGEKLWSVRIDDYKGARLAVEHLIQSGHRRIGYVGTPDRPKSSERRYLGYQTVLAEAGLTAGKDLGLHGFADTDFETGMEAADDVLAAQVTAVFCYNDRIALGLMAAMRERSVRVPLDLSIIGFDDVDDAKYAVPGLTTIRQPQLQLGQYAFEMLLDLLADKPVEDKVLPCELVVRGTTRILK